MEVPIINFMSEQKYFQNALSDFTYEAASGGAIRHLADAGYTAKQISEKLTFPTPYERVQKILWQHLLATEVVLLEEPGSGKSWEKPVYITEHDKYGRISFRRALAQRENSGQIYLKESSPFSGQESHGKRGKKLAELLAEKCNANGEKEAYVSCSFGGDARKDVVEMEALDARQREYISGLLWERKICYHRLDQRMREIIVRLYEAGWYHGSCYFLKLQEKITL